jgi:uncharacterized membrane protein
MLALSLFGFTEGLMFLLQQGSESSWIKSPEGSEVVRILLRWIHFAAGITWIGILYFFNLVNVPLMKKLDAPTKGKVIPELMPRALWWFRWGAVVTVFVGLTYYPMYIIRSEATQAGMEISVWGVLGKWLLVVIVAWAIMYALLQPVSGALNKGAVLAVLDAVVVLGMSALIVYLLGSRDEAGHTLGNKSLSIGIGGGLGVIMLLNVWGIIWPAQKRIIAWTKDNAENGTPIPAESAKLARRAFLASRTNFWLSLPMLFFMATSHGDYIWFAG